jgi:hypothetical protein
MEIKWHKLKDLAAKKFNDVHKAPGIYFVRWSRNGKPISIPRLGGLDNMGILYIGSAANLRSRIRRLWRGINGQVEAHTIGKTIIFCKIFEVVNSNEYEVSWNELETPKTAKGQEWTAVALYAEKYKEPPPLNLLLQREMFAICGIAISGKSRVVHEPDDFVRSIMNS